MVSNTVIRDASCVEDKVSSFPLTLNALRITVLNVPGGHTGGATPVPIPNTEVKPSKADATAAVRQWESRTLPGFKKACW